MDKIDVQIMDRNLTLSVTSADKAKLLAAVAHADELMKSIRSVATNLSPERVAIMASIKLASDLLGMESSDGPFKGVQFGDFQSKLNEINSLLDQGISELKNV